jgi:hypothetical protein
VSGHAPNDRADLAIKKKLVWLAKPYDIEVLAHETCQVVSRDHRRSPKVLVATPDWGQV